MVRWKARVDFLLTVIELLFCILPLTRYKAKRVKTHWFLERVGQFQPRFQGEGVVPREYSLISRRLDTFCYLKCKLHRATCSRVDTIPMTADGQTVGHTVGQTVGIAIAVQRLQCEHCGAL